MARACGLGVARWPLGSAGRRRERGSLFGLPGRKVRECRNCEGRRRQQTVLIPPAPHAMREHIHFVTGRLAEFSLREVLERVSGQLGFEYSVDVLGITVAALMTTDWVAPRMRVPPGTTRVLLPGYCQGELAIAREAAGVTVERGPRDLRRLGEYLSAAPVAKEYGSYDIQILAEINHAPQLTVDALLHEAARLRADGADLIDVGCTPGSTW